MAASIRAANMPPIGWAGDGVRALQQSSGWLWKVFGILSSTVAVARGAPFWFDLLNKIVNLRAPTSGLKETVSPARAFVQRTNRQCPTLFETKAVVNSP